MNCVVCQDKGCEFCPRVHLQAVPQYRSDSDWEETDYELFAPAEYETNWGRVRLQVEQQQRDFEERRRKAQRQGHIGGVILLLAFFVGLPLAAAGIHVLLHL